MQDMEHAEESNTIQTLVYMAQRKLQSNLALAIADQLGGGAGNGELARLLDLGLEGNLVSVSPHLGDESLAGNHNAGEADLDVLKRAEPVVDGLAGEAEAAEAVKNRGLETTQLGEFGIEVKRAGLLVWLECAGTDSLLVIAAQSVDGRLVLASGLLDDDVGVTAWGLVGGSGSAAILASLGTAKATASAEEDGHLVVKEILTGIGIDRGDAVLGNGSGALVDNLQEAASRDEARACGDGELSNLEVLLAVEKHHGRKVGHNGVVIKRHLSVEGRNDAKGGNDLEVVGTLTVCVR